jgi:prefoldin subunit 5
MSRTEMYEFERLKNELQEQVSELQREIAELRRELDWERGGQR